MSEIAARRWLSQDPDPQTRKELEDLLADSSRAEELEERFAGRLEFGTAGLRGLLGAGPTRMNRVLVKKVSAGLGNYLVATLGAARGRKVVVGYDGRHKSRIFAEDTAQVLLGQGYTVVLATTVVPTPLVSYAVDLLQACAGVMVTASHNPPEYNGYKVYWGNGAQIIPPHDSGIAAAVSEVAAVDKLPCPELSTERAQGRLLDLDEETIDGYFAGVNGLCVNKEVVGQTPLIVAYTAMHGVGAPSVRRALAESGVSALHVEPSQEEPDGDFPTVSFPNPEEKGAMDRVFALATRVKAELVLANDPDADRLAVALPSENGKLTMLTGDQVGCLLADYLLAEGEGTDARLVSTTLVSSQLLKFIAKKYGAQFQSTLTGFKWISNGAMDAKKSRGERFVMGYEEALGYSIGELVRDKDGVSAANLFCELAAFEKSRGRSVWKRLEDIYRQHGRYATRQESLVLPGSDGLEKIGSYMADFRARAPKEIAGFPVTEFQDLLDDSAKTGYPKSNVLVYFLEGNRRVIMRPSGTEPKLKCYYEVCEPVASEEPMEKASERAAISLTALCEQHQGMLG